MKNIFLVLLMFVMIPVANAATALEADVTARRLEMIERYAPKITSKDTFLRAAKEGNIAAIAQLQDESVLKATDKFGNNCFHLAKDAQTVQAIAGSVRRLKGEDFINTINHLRNQRNEMGELPVMRHINYGNAETFRLLYEGTRMAWAVKQARAVDKGGALRPAAEVKKSIAVAWSKDNSGRTIAQAALANHKNPGMSYVVHYFKVHAPYLF